MPPFPRLNSTCYPGKRRGELCPDLDLEGRGALQGGGFGPPALYLPVHQGLSHTQNTPAPRNQAPARGDSLLPLALGRDSRRMRETGLKAGLHDTEREAGQRRVLGVSRCQPVDFGLGSSTQGCRTGPSAQTQCRKRAAEATSATLGVGASF